MANNVVNTPPASDQSGTGVGMMVGIVIVLAIVIMLFLIFGGRLGGGGGGADEGVSNPVDQQQGIDIDVPEQVNLNVDSGGAPAQ